MHLIGNQNKYRKEDLVYVEHKGESWIVDDIRERERPEPSLPPRLSDVLANSAAKENGEGLVPVCLFLFEGYALQTHKGVEPIIFAFIL